ncbi:MAG: diadenylate cyclase CdaA [Bulleidia sp.]|nr:diadenylate cyclase CdaA [Bulleidia sp.]
MSIYSFGLTFSNIRSFIVMLLDIFVMWFIFFYALKIVRSNQRTIQIFKGIILVIVIDALAKLLGLKSLEYLADMFINYGFLAIIIIFQPEIRSLLEKIGQSNIFSRMTTLTGNEKENLVDQIVTAVMLLSKDQTGALISIEESQSLDAYVATGTKLNSDVTAELLTSLFVTSTPLHDGAVIIQGDKIACASAYFPPTNADLPSRFGARHRAAIGFSEVTDAVTIVVSEETGAVSITEAGKIIPIKDRKSLREYLYKAIVSSNNDKSPKKPNGGEEDTRGILSMLKVKKQSAPQENVREDIIHDEVQKDVQMIHQLADEEAKAAEIKLPHKKKRPAASYPAQERKIVPQQVTTQAKVQPVAKMTPEEVKAARENAYNQYKVQKETKITPILNEEDRQFDTSKLDISKIVGFNHELEKEFKMVEKLDNTSKNDSKGGDRE